MYEIPELNSRFGFMAAGVIPKKSDEDLHKRLRDIFENFAGSLNEIIPMNGVKFEMLGYLEKCAGSAHQAIQLDRMLKFKPNIPGTPLSEVLANLQHPDELCPDCRPKPEDVINKTIMQSDGTVK